MVCDFDGVFERRSTASSKAVQNVLRVPARDRSWLLPQRSVPWSSIDSANQMEIPELRNPRCSLVPPPTFHSRPLLLALRDARVARGYSAATTTSSQPYAFPPVVCGSQRTSKPAECLYPQRRKSPHQLHRAGEVGTDVCDQHAMRV